LGVQGPVPGRSVKPPLMVVGWLCLLIICEWRAARKRRRDVSPGDTFHTTPGLLLHCVCVSLASALHLISGCMQPMQLSWLHASVGLGILSFFKNKFTVAQNTQSARQATVL